MSEASLRKSADVLSYNAGKENLHPDKEALRLAKEKFGPLAMKIQNDALAGNAMQKEYLRLKEQEEESMGDVEYHGELMSSTQVPSAISDAIKEKFSEVDKLTLEEITNILSKYETDLKDAYSLMDYFAAAQIFEIRTRSV